MEKLMIRGGRPLRGTVQISGAKNSAIALIARGYIGGINSYFG